MKIKLKNHSIKALSIALPRQLKSLEEELKECNLSLKKYELLSLQSGIRTHFNAPKQVFASDLAIKALEGLFELEPLAKRLDMLVLSSFTPDFYCPSLSSLVAKGLNLNENVLCFDEISFCAGFLQGLFKAFLALENEDIQSVVLICVNTKSKKLSPKDRALFLSNTDSASALLIEKSKIKETAFYTQQTHSQYALKETLPCNAFNESFDDFIKVDGDFIFSFVMDKFPHFFEDFLKEAKLKRGELFLQAPNAFFKKRLLEKMGFEYKDDELFRNFGDANINKIPLELALRAENAKLGGGIELFSKKDGLENTNFSLLASFGTGIVFNALALKINFEKLKSMIKIYDFTKS
ncbi:3-oxoacyl-ACP synthase [Campylobacter sp. MIT 99-7217]|uniref:3-oxoacyl-ACP synthase n=1 Tax=Campylobacter sp. MIT 99-7217 TaxID=535091 RepID=UPI00115B220D|nr:3-oxoacyl-ACP synthase [Campylobacter sp. MIT 99-7217]TQR33831.1 3-oxoacyl-ACP synthase [Campylobacter sp. MIT 99-7217]